jgi:hypothetical protein
MRFQRQIDIGAERAHHRRDRDASKRPGLRSGCLLPALRTMSGKRDCYAITEDSARRVDHPTLAGSLMCRIRAPSLALSDLSAVGVVAFS